MNIIKRNVNIYTRWLLIEVLAIILLPLTILVVVGALILSGIAALGEQCKRLFEKVQKIVDTDKEADTQGVCEMTRWLFDYQE